MIVDATTMLSLVLLALTSNRMSMRPLGSNVKPQKLDKGRSDQRLV